VHATEEAYEAPYARSTVTFLRKSI